MVQEHNATLSNTIITTICNWKNDTADGKVMVSDKYKNNPPTFYLECEYNEGKITNILKWCGKCTSLTSSCFGSRNTEMAFFYNTYTKEINLHKTVPEDLPLSNWTEPTTAAKKKIQTIDPMDKHQMASIKFKTDYQNKILWPHIHIHYFSNLSSVRGHASDLCNINTPSQASYSFVSSPVKLACG